MSQTAPQPTGEGWQRIEADERQAQLLERLHPVLSFEVGEALYIGASVDTTGALLAEPGEELRVRSIGNNVARVENVRSGYSALVQLSQLADAAVRPWSSGT